MKKVLLAAAGIALVAAAFAVVFILNGESALVAQPKGMIARKQWHLMLTNLGLMLVVIVPTLILLFVAVKRQLKGSSKNPLKEVRQWILWVIPTVIVAIMAFITYRATHQLDPYRPIVSEKEPLHIQVIALDWKWLFIYKELGIASLNYLQIPDQTPIRFSLSADGSPMNSFWIPQLSGQIYSMTGMVTTLYVQADGPGEYIGRAAEINGDGFADMTFLVKSTSPLEFQNWVRKVKASKNPLTQAAYAKLVPPSKNEPIKEYFPVEKGLFENAVKKYVTPPK